MTYLPTYSIQTQYFFYSIILGVIIGIIYDVLRAVREAIEYQRSPKFYFSDILIFIIAAFLFEAYTLAYGYGQIRGYALLGTGLGFLLYINTFGALLYHLEKTFAFIMNIPVIFFIKTLKNLYLLLYNNCVIFVNRVKNRLRQRIGEQSEKGEEEQQEFLPDTRGNRRDGILRYFPHFTSNRNKRQNQRG